MGRLAKDKDKHSSLFQKSVNYSLEIFTAYPKVEHLKGASLR
jgi:hypothetical protein